MSNVKGPNNIIHIAYIGRLEKEKGVEDILKIIQNTKFSDTIHWDIIGTGSYYSSFSKLDRKNITLYGKIQKGEIYSILRNLIDITIMPSKFLETFGLVALESNLCGVPVIGYKKGGLMPFISEKGILNEKNIVYSFDTYIEEAFNNGIEAIQSNELYTREHWRHTLEQLTKTYTRILLVHDYIDQIGGAEIYIHDLKDELEKLGKNVHIFGNPTKKPSKILRIVNSIFAPFAIWNKWKIEKEIQTFEPELIWMHGIMRSIGYFGIQSIMSSNIHTFLTHHDFGLMSSRPSQIFEESDIPKGLSIGQFLNGSHNIFEIAARIGKYIYISVLWKQLERVSIHIAPSEFMCQHIETFSAKPCIVFTHSVELSSAHQS